MSLRAYDIENTHFQLVLTRLSMLSEPSTSENDISDSQNLIFNSFHISIAYKPFLLEFSPLLQIFCFYRQLLTLV